MTADGGCRRLPAQGLEKLGPQFRRDGVEVIAHDRVRILPPTPTTARFDLRNHRKLAGLDGASAMPVEKSGDLPSFPDIPNEELVDQHHGSRVAQIQAILLADSFIEPGAPSTTALYSGIAAAAVSSQLLPSGRLSRENAQDCLSRCSTAARERVVSPRRTSCKMNLSFPALRSQNGVEWKCGIALPHANQAFTQLARAHTTTIS